MPSTTERPTVKDAVCDPPDLESVAVIVWACCAPTVVGVPLITPVEASNESPAGRVAGAIA